MVANGRSTNSGWLQEGVIRGSMLGKTMLPTDEELGKKDDDHRYKPARHPSSSTSSPPFRWRRRRVYLVVLGFLALSLVLHIFRSPRPPPPKYAETAFESDREPTGPPPGTRISRDGVIPHTYDGQIRFFRLAKSLRATTSLTNGYQSTNRNVVFAISSLKSAGNLLPMICDMTTWNRNWVHAVFVGREDIPLDTLLEINGVDKTKCPAFWHDARPDYAEYSTDARAELIVMAALSHIHEFLRPQVVITDDARLEDTFFVKASRVKTETLEIPLIEIPQNRWEDFAWMTRLDVGSLSSWFLPTVDLLIQVPPDSASVLRLLKSIKEADYKGLKPPRITLELPADMDIALKQRLETFDWPPDNNPSNNIVLRRRIANHGVTQEESAIRFLELFYPTDSNSHVLLLSPQAQLSPQYFHYLTYTLLEYKYSSFGGVDNANLMGLSLELPSALLDGKTELIPPTTKNMHNERYKKLRPDTPSVPFLWQAPNSHATLFHGDKWAELHSFLRHRVAKHHQSSKPAARQKLVSETLPSWTEYMLEFMRARGYALLYPATTSADALVTIHNELYHAPEEYAPASRAKTEKADDAPADVPNEAFLRAPSSPRAPVNAERPLSPASRPLHQLLPFNGDLPEVAHLPRLLHDGTRVSASKMGRVAVTYADEFRVEVGGCAVYKDKKRKVVSGEAGDLFCYGDEDEGDWVEAVVVDEGFLGVCMFGRWVVGVLLWICLDI
ncbi:hypothetical protein P153DRAFT_423003 [Dothidotthia symphoricarpi CBS 119687]|uniref:Uncharacterized protein n=1 Tax=Dothidotthia symphoricarpi CBS 119687 TaxID=1392245 RepID=A0A6A6ABS8_9PLEO|nr:uncharacterized protein P153DRAFT_423003 [Dothidotthia symphoricarpi CBS 119687]KAF2129402.1 hypothetical protein P153DRAFT_423003 [Dothidotthia symphoricarpi CBS 119687]